MTGVDVVWAATRSATTFATLVASAASNPLTLITTTVPVEKMSNRARSSSGVFTPGTSTDPRTLGDWPSVA